MRKLKRATVEIKGEEFNLTPKQLLNIYQIWIIGI
jgi:hypothetical protein